MQSFLSQPSFLSNMYSMGNFSQGYKENNFPPGWKFLNSEIKKHFLLGKQEFKLMSLLYKLNKSNLFFKWKKLQKTSSSIHTKLLLSNITSCSSSANTEKNTLLKILYCLCFHIKIIQITFQSNYSIETGFLG